MLKWIIAGVLAIFFIAASLFFFGIPARVDANYNQVIAHDRYPVSDKARLLHASIPVSDLHADTMLWMRDPLKRHGRGHVDLPRLKDGGVKLQLFTAVTKTPSSLNYEENEADSDDITLLMIAQRWPRATHHSLLARAMHQAARLDNLEQRAGGDFVFAKNAGELRAALAGDAVVGLYGIEGAHPLEGDIENVDRLFDAGLRVMGLQHFFDNKLGGSLHGKSGDGLTPFGRAAIERATDLGMIIDVAHSSEQTVRDVLAQTDRPLVVSHTGLKGFCDTPRNISDDLMQEIAVEGGLIGIGFWDAAICEATLENIAAAIIYAVDLLGADHVAIGSDFDGTITAPLDVSEMPALTQALMDAGLDEATVRAVMGENAVRFFLENLPA